MSLSPTRTEQAALPPQPTDARPSLVSVVAKAIVRAQKERRFGCYDYSKYPGTDAPHVIRDEIAGRELYRGWDHDACQALYVEITQTYVAERALGAVVEFYRGKI